MGERGGRWDSDSDETVVEGSVIESDVEGEELHSRRLSFVNMDMSLTTEVRIDEGAPSPEICFIHRVHDRPYILKEEKQISLIPQETNASDRSQSLLQGWINSPSLSENISEPVFSLNATVEGQQNNSVDLDNRVVGFLKDSEEKISQKLSDEDLSPETSLCLDAFLEELIMIPKEQTPQDIFPHVLEDCQRTSLTVIDTDNTVKEHSLKNDTDLSLTSLGTIFMEAFSEQRILTSEFEISDLLKPLSDSESPKMINPLRDVLECQGHALSIDTSADEKSDALPVELVAALNSLSGSVVQVVAPEVPNERQLSTEEEQLNLEPSIPRLDDDCTQLTNTFEPQLSTVQAEEIKAITRSDLQRTTNEQLVGDQQREKEVISDYWRATLHENSTEEGSSRSLETDLCAETTKATSRRAMQIRGTSSRKRRDHVSSCHQILQETQQRISHNGNTTRNKAKDFEKIQKSTSKDKQDLETNICQRMNGNRTAEQTRRSKRIKKKIRQEACIRNSLNPVFPISLSRINRRNIFGETLLHKAVADEDIDLVCNIIKAGANINAQDYAGWTALHEASVEGLYRIANELLKAGADVNARGSEQITPLQDAVKEGHYEMAELLLWYGADPLLKDEMGRCALEEASDQSMRKLLKSYVAKYGRDSEEISAGEDAENMLSAQSLGDTNLHQTELNSDGTVQHDHTEASKEDFAKNEQSGKTNLVTHTESTVLQDLEGRRLNEKNLKHKSLESKKTKKSVIDMAEAAAKSKITQKGTKHGTYVSSLGPSTNQGTIEIQKAFFSGVGPNEMGFNADVSDHNYCSTVDAEGNLSLLNQAEMQKEHGFHSGNNENPFTEEKKRTDESTATSVIKREEKTSLHCPTSSISAEEMSVKHSQTIDLTEPDSQSMLSLNSSHSVSLLKLQQEIKSYDSDQHSLKQSGKDSLTGRNLNTDMRIPSEQIISLKHLTNQVKSDVDGNKINGEALNLKLSLPLLQEVSLQINESESACASLTDSERTDILQQTIGNEVQNTCTNISADGNNCAEETLQTNTETLLAHELLATTNGECVSKSSVNCSSGVLSTTEQKAQQPEEGRRVLLNTEESAEGFLTETTENASNSEITSTALQLHEKEALQIQRKRQDLHDTKMQICFVGGINADKETPYSSQIMQSTEQETLQKIDEGVFAEISGTEGTEKNEEERNAKSDVLSQFTETEAVQTKRVKLDPQETRQKTDLCSRSSKSKLSLNQSQFSQRSKGQTSKKSESSKKEAVILHVAYNTRAWTKKRNAKGENQLHIAAKRGDLSLVKTLISSGICVNEKDNAGWTAIHEASNRGFTEVILELLKAGANINSRSLDGTLPIHDAVSGNYLEVVRILLQHGANPHERDDSGETALDKACDHEMKELLKSYGAIDSGLPVKTTGITERKYSHPTRSRRSKLICYDCCKNDDAALVPQHEKYNVHESVAAIQDTEQKQKELFLLELRTSKDADAYIQKLSQIQDTLNEMLAKQKTERDALAKKYRASVESFKKGALREQLVKLASRQKSLLIVAQNQKELVQKIQNYRKEKQVYSTHSKKQISNAAICYGNGKGQDLTADKITCPDVVTFSRGPGASMPNGNGVEAHLSLENRFSAQECSQHPNSCLAETGANKEAIRSKGVSDHALASETRVREYPFHNMSKLTNAVEVVTLPSEPNVFTTETKCPQQKCIDCVAIAKQGDSSLYPTSVTKTLNISEAQSAVISNNVCQPTSDCERVLTVEDLHSYVNKKEAFLQQQQQQQVTASASTENLPNTLQQMIFQSSVESFNANSVITSLVSNRDYPINLNQKSSSQSCSNQQYEQKQLKYRRNNRKKLQLIDLLELGRIKPGENVLEFKLQEFSHKATLLEDGKIKTNNSRILQNPVQWVKELLGSDISVTWKYVWNKVTYLGTQLSKFLVEEVSISDDLELPSQQGEPVGSSVQFNSANLMHFLLFNEIVIVHKDEFLPCHIMEKHWNFYKECEDFGF
ncbi:ankyrin repeat domain-containing protein 31-like [Struthio camelus]|uniref:ankyrin repeat domain-containing protein 31-like n=1 Tax=Struthio camelus TaxID=8801 RepID=UPI003603C05F